MIKTRLNYNKKGFTLVEAMAAIVIIGILTSGVLVAVVFARMQLSSSSAMTGNIAEAQGTMDVLVSSLSMGETNTATLASRTHASFIPGGGFSFNPSSPNQFTFTSSIINGNTQYAITVVSFYQNGERRITLTGSAVDTGNTFSVG